MVNMCIAIIGALWQQLSAEQRLKMKQTFEFSFVGGINSLTSIGLSHLIVGDSVLYTCTHVHVRNTGPTVECCVVLRKVVCMKTEVS